MGRYDFNGYRRENGRVGIRNHVVILPLDDLSNAACESVANNIKGTLALPHAYGRLQFGEDLELFFRTLIGMGSNPNVAACVVIGIEPGWTARIVDGIATTGKPVAGFAIEENGDIGTVARASRTAREFMQWASERQRERCDIADLFMSTKCGESDTTSGLGSCPTVGNMIDKLDPLGVTSCFGETSEITGAETVCASRAITKDVGDRFLQVFNAYQDVIQRHKTDDLSDSQPTKGNIIGGLTTIEEKAFGNLQKIGKKTKYIEVLKPAEAPAKGPGLYYMDTSSAAAECITLQAAAGFVVRAGQRHRQPHRAGHQAHRQPENGADDGRAHGPRCVGHPAPRNDDGSGRRSADRHGDPHVQRPAHLRRGHGTPRVRADQAVSDGMTPRKATEARRHGVARGGASIDA